MEHIPLARRLDFEENSLNNDENIDRDLTILTENEPTTQESLHSTMPNDLVPVIGMEFENENFAYDFYNAYAKKVGFSIRRNKIHTTRDGKILDRTFCCSCQGKRVEDKRDDNVKLHRSNTRTGCLAELRVSSRLTGKFRVYKFVSEHNHNLISPRKCHLLRSQRKITTAQKAELDMVDRSGITPKATMELLSNQVGGRENLGFIPEDYKNYLRSKRTSCIEVGDTGGVLEYLQKQQTENPCFSYAIQVDMNDLITNIFWADAKMKVDYGHFGDVVCFDTTYKKNKEGRPFALFVGVNHHKQTVIFGAALLYDETIETFEWLFKTFSKTMLGKMPKTILTDQDRAMDAALVSIWPETYHRLCVWHIYQNAAGHLSSIFDQFKDFAKDFSSCVYDHDEVDDFINAWYQMLEKYNLQNNEWLKKLFEKKEKWALVYGRHTFCADMSTTQRSESMNSQIKRYIDYKYDLLRFFQHFERLVEDRRYEELKADFKSINTTPFLAYPVEILTHVAGIYTSEVFKIFYKEMWKTWNCNIDLCMEVDSICEYKVTPFERKISHTIIFDASKGTVTCSCKKFDFVGILCSHALKVFSLKNIRRVPDKYILKRWTKDAKVETKEAAYEISDNIDPKTTMAKHYKDLLLLFNPLAARAAEREETYKIVIDGYNKLVEDVEKKFREFKVEASSSENHDSLHAKNKETSEKIMDSSIDIPHAKGLKRKEKKSIDKGATRRVNALEKATKKKDVRK